MRGGCVRIPLAQPGEVRPRPGQPEKLPGPGDPEPGPEPLPPQEALADAADPADPEQDFSRRQRAQALREVLDALGEPDREILLRRYCWDQKPREIAAALDLPVKQIDNRLYRTKQSLRAHVQLEELP